MTPLLSVDDLHVGYGELLVLKGFTLEVRAAEFVALVGPNGAGKSTLLRAVAGLLPLRSGAIRLAGERIDGLAPYEIAARGIVLIPEGRRLFGEKGVARKMPEDILHNRLFRTAVRFGHETQFSLLGDDPAFVESLFENPSGFFERLD